MEAIFIKNPVMAVSLISLEPKGKNLYWATKAQFATYTNTNQKYKALFYPFLINVQVIIVFHMAQHHKRYGKCSENFLLI